jgi:hypothetical protein
MEKNKTAEEQQREYVKGFAEYRQAIFGLTGDVLKTHSIFEIAPVVGDLYTQVQQAYAQALRAAEGGQDKT